MDSSCLLGQDSSPTVESAKFCSPFRSWNKLEGFLAKEQDNLRDLMNREELLRLYILKLDEEANYFKASSPTEEEFCNCPKCQVKK